MYANIEPSGCSVRRGAVQLRIDLFMNESDSRYLEHYVHVIDENSAEYKSGYKGNVIDGEPVDKTAYNKWLERLPKKWQNNSFHSHFIQISPDTTDSEIKNLIQSVLDIIGSEYDKCGDTIQAARQISTSYKPFDVVAKEEKKVIDELREKGSSGLVDNNTCLLLTRSALRVLDVINKKDSFRTIK